MSDLATKAGARAAARLRDVLILWLTTVTAASQPQASPVWFLWTDDEILLYSRADTPRPANIRANPRVAANLDSDGEGGDVVSIEGEARIACEQAPRPAFRRHTWRSTRRRWRRTAGRWRASSSTTRWRSGSGRPGFAAW